MAASDASTVLPEVVEFGQKHGLSTSAQMELQGLMNASITLTQKKVTVVVPATVANLGPGLETCGLAVDIWDEFTVEYSEHFHLEAFGDYSADVPRATDQNLAVLGAKFAFEASGRPFPSLRISCTHNIPYKQGLGGPSASFVGGYLAGSVLCSEELSSLVVQGEKSEIGRTGSLADVLGQSPIHRIPSSAAVAAAFPAPPAGHGPSERGGGLDTLLQQAISRGWNPGNVCPAIYGALQIGTGSSTGFESHRVPMPNGLVCVLWVPGNLNEGERLPKQAVDRKAAIFNVGRMALLTNCFCTGNFEMFSKATEDTLAQPHCASQFPFVTSICQAAVDAGASGAFACGYGPSVMALITGRTGDILAQSSFEDLERAVAKAMLSKADEVGQPGRILIAKPADVGAHVLAQKSELASSADGGRIVYFQ